MARNESKIAQDYRSVFGTTEGQRVLAHIMAQCKVYSPIEPGPGKDMDLGARNIGLMIATYLAYRPADFVQRARDHNSALSALIGDAEE